MADADRNGPLLTQLVFYLQIGEFRVAGWKLALCEAQRKLLENAWNWIDPIMGEVREGRTSQNRSGSSDHTGGTKADKITGRIGKLGNQRLIHRSERGCSMPSVDQAAVFERSGVKAEAGSDCSFTVPYAVRNTDTRLNIAEVSRVHRAYDLQVAGGWQ